MRRVAGSLAVAVALCAVALVALVAVVPVSGDRSTVPFVLGTLTADSTVVADANAEPLTDAERKALADAAYEREDQRRFGELRHWLVSNGGYLAEKVRMKTMLEYGGHGLVVAQHDTAATHAAAPAAPAATAAATPAATTADASAANATVPAAPGPARLSDSPHIEANETYICVPYRLALSLSTLNMSGLCPQCFTFWPHRHAIWDVDGVGWDSPDVDTTSVVAGLFLALQRWHLDTYWPVNSTRVAGGPPASAGGAPDTAGLDAALPPAMASASSTASAVPRYSRTFWQPLVHMLPEGCVNAANFALYPDVLDSMWGSLSHKLLRDVSDAVHRAWAHVLRIKLGVKLTLAQFVWSVHPHHSTPHLTTLCQLSSVFVC